MLSVAVMAHPKRAGYVAELLERLETTPTISWDTDGNRWHTGRAALLAYPPEATHHLVLQDDAVIPLGLVETCGRLLAHVPTVPVSLYMGQWRHRPYKFSMKVVTDTALEKGASFAAFGGPWWGVGVILPTRHIPGVVANGDSSSSHRNYDIKIAQYFKAKRIPCWYTMPSVVEHREGVSLVGPRSTKRHAMWWESDTADLDWSGGCITPADMDVRRFPTTP
jgi:hypothetical protein